MGAVAACALALALGLRPGDAAAACENAADVAYVDRDATCPGDGTSESPWCSLQRAMDNAAPGRTIRIRDAAAPYGAATTGLSATSGTEGAPIVIEPDCGHAPVFDARVTLVDVSWWTIRGLTFVDPQDVALVVRAADVDTQGLRVLDNVVLGGSSDFGGIMVSRDSGSTQVHVDIEIAGNVLMNVADKAMQVRHTVGGTVAHNVVTAVRCGPANDTESQPQVGLETTGVDGLVIAHNWFGEFPSTCAPGDARIAGVRLRGGTGTLERNVVSGIPLHADAAFVGGISTLDDAHDWVIRRNVIIDAGGCGLCDGTEFNGAADNEWLHNTVIATEGQPAIATEETTGVVLRGNLLLGAGGDIGRVLDPAVVAMANHNLYWSTEGEVSFRIAGATGQTLAQWRDQCACDAASVVDDPGIVLSGDDLTPAADGPAIDAGVSLGEPFVGDAPDLGAFEAPIAVSATAQGDPPVVLVAFADVPFPPLHAAGCGGLSVQVGDEALPLASCTVQTEGGGTTTLALTLARGPMQASMATVRHEGGTLVDSLAAGGRLGASVPAFELEVALPATADPDPPDDDEMDEPFPDPDLGCACRPVVASPIAGACWLVALGLGAGGAGRRRR